MKPFSPSGLAEPGCLVGRVLTCPRAPAQLLLSRLSLSCQRSDGRAGLRFSGFLPAASSASTDSEVIFYKMRAVCSMLWKDALHIGLPVWLSGTFYPSQSSKYIEGTSFSFSSSIYRQTHPPQSCRTLSAHCVPALSWFSGTSLGTSEPTSLTCQNPGQTFLLLQSDLVCHFSELTTQKSYPWQAHSLTMKFYLFILPLLSLQFP